MDVDFVLVFDVCFVEVVVVVEVIVVNFVFLDF